jgi:hypothetical protein
LEFVNGLALFLRFTAIPAQVGPGVRIRLAPAASRQTLGPGGFCFTNAVGTVESPIEGRYGFAAVADDMEAADAA